MLRESSGWWSLVQALKLGMVKASFPALGITLACSLQGASFKELAENVDIMSLHYQLPLADLPSWEERAGPIHLECLRRQDSFLRSSERTLVWPQY